MTFALEKQNNENIKLWKDNNKQNRGVWGNIPYTNELKQHSE